MKYESSVTSLSWIPSEAITGSMRLAFDAGVGHYDDPPPAELSDLAELQAADRFRYANVLRAWVEVGETARSPKRLLRAAALSAPLPSNSVD